MRKRFFDKAAHKRLRAVAGALLLVCSTSVTIWTSFGGHVEAVPCPCSVFTSDPSPGDDTDAGGIEVGMKFKSEVSGYVTGARFYKTAVMTGAHTGNLWSSNGTLLATVSFSGESASGWQEMSFSSPVSVTAETIYTISMFAADGRYAYTTNYFTSPVNNYPLRAPAQGTADATDALANDGQGVFNDGNSSAYPVFTFNRANYWVDVAFVANQGSSAPTVTSTYPAVGATGVSTAITVKATIDDTMDPSTITSDTVSVRDASNNLVAGTISYSTSTKVVSFTPTSPFTAGTTYTVTIEGGSGTVAENFEGIALAADYAWSFTISATDPCPCSLKSRANPAGSSVFDDAGSLELGTKVRPIASGYITAIRFYKPVIATETTHTGNIWSSAGANLATVTFSGETDYGWQEATLATPLAVSQDQTYVVSYGTTAAQYIALVGGLNSTLTGNYITAPADTSADNAATGSGNRNGVFTTTAGNYPSSGTTNGSYYFVDAVFATNSTDVAPLAVSVVQPTSGAFGIAREVVVSARFNRTLDTATVTNSTVRLFNSSNVQVAGTGSYSTATGEARFTPSSNLTYGQTYTARLSATIADNDGNALGSEYSWSFTVGSQLTANPAVGPGGPILAITSAGNKYSQYYAEILRTEGLNYFDTKDIGTVTATTLDAYDAVVLSEMSLTQSQADMFSAWVQAGGNLIAMRPDKKLASLLGLADASSTRSNQYLLINTFAAPGTGIVAETVQFKGTADNYTLNGATSVATLYSDASSSTSNPAVTIRQVGSSGGTAAAFTYDLAKSVVALHQGNQAWAGQDRDANSPIRTNDLFFGAMSGDVQDDWVDPDKIHIPQADEQQRLLANIITEATKDLRPMPRFWYLPQSYEAALVLAGDDHNLNDNVGTEYTMAKWLNESATDCSLVDWNCVRASHYVYPTSDLTNARALQYHNLGFEVGDHVNTNCVDYPSYSDLGTTYTNHLASWAAKFSSLPSQTTHRFHCYTWSDWDSQPRVEHDNGIRYDLNYVGYPSSWIGSRTPVLTGSGMNMRLTDADGDLLDVYQGVTNLDDTVAGTAVVEDILDNATGSPGYYGIFGTHYDMSNSYHQTLFDVASDRNVPMITAKQALTWLDGRGSSTFSNFGGSNGQFTFDVTTAVGAYNLRAMLPINDAGGTLTSLKIGSSTVSYQTQAVKGVQYAVFNATPGSYTALYSDYGTGGSSGSGSSGGGTSTPKKTTTVATGEESAEAEEQTTENEADDIAGPQTTEQPGEDELQPDTTGKTSAWLRWSLIIGLPVVGLGVLWAIRWHRHRLEP